ncbi:MAG: thioredoxin family protein [Pelomonas sp.]|nr:thioredoxin family protein [Roseateles sp.]
MPVSSPTPPVSLVCLCAAWCRLCDDYRPLFERVAAELRATVPQVEARWIDIEDEAELVGELDIETFPTLVIAGPEGVRFAGPLLPREDTLRRLVAHAITDVAPDAAWPRAAPEFSAFAARLRAAT